MEVPSGKIYKHLFEAQTQLAKSLEKSRQSRQKSGIFDTKSKQTSKVGWNAKTFLDLKDSKPESFLGICRNSEKNKNQIDKEKQDAIDKFVLSDKDYELMKIEDVNDYYIENDADRVKELEDEINLVQNIQTNFPTQLDDQSSSKTITQRLTEKRLEKHSASLAKLDSNLSLVKNNSEKDLKGMLTTFSAMIKNKIMLAKSLLEPLENEAKENILYQRQIESLEDQWVCIRSVFNDLKSDIHNISNQINYTEKERSKQLTTLLLNARRDLQKIAYLNEADVARLIAELITSLNKSLIQNRKYFSDIIARLGRHVVSEQLNCHVFSRKYLLVWKEQYVDQVVENFKNYINTPEINQPQDQLDAFTELKNYHKKVWQTLRDENINKIFLNFSPPNCTRNNAQKIINEFENLRDQLNSKNMKFLHDSINVFRESEQKRTAQIDNFKNELLEKQVCDVEEVYKVENDRLKVLSTEISSNHAKIIQDTSIFMEDISIRFKSQIDTIRRLLLALGRIWDNHRDKCTGLEKLMIFDFNKQKSNFKHNINLREQNLENSLKKLRQQTSDDQLSTVLTSIESQIKTIKQQFTDYEKSQIEKLATFKPVFSKEASSYNKEIISFFESLKEFLNGPNVLNSCNDEALQLFEAVKKIESQMNSDNADLDSEINSLRSSLNLTAEQSSRPQTSSSSNRPKTSWSLFSKRAVSQSSSKSSTISSTKLYIDQLMHEAESSEPTRTILLDGSELLTFESVPDYVAPLIVLDEGITLIVDKIKEMMVNHTLDYEKISTENYNSQTKVLIQGIKDEINLELQLYNQKPEEIKENIYGTRKSEVDEHKFRVQRHLRAINEQLENIKYNYMKNEKTLIDGQSEFNDWCKSREPIVQVTKKSDELVKILDNIRLEMENRKHDIEIIARDFKEELTKSVGNIKNSNKKLISSFKQFSEGGNFSPEEVATLTRRIEKAGNKVSMNEQKFDYEIEELKIKLTHDQSMDVALKAEDKLKYHLVDVVFIEQCQRWLTNTQVKIRAVVAKCNSQASEVRVSTDKLNDMLNLPIALNVTDEDHFIEIKEQLEFVMELLMNRVELLSCRKNSGKEIEELASLKNAAVSEVKSESNPGSCHSIDNEAFIRKNKQAVKNQKKRTGQQRMCQPSYINADVNKPDNTIPKQPELVQHSVLTSLGVITVRRREVKFDIKYLLFGAFQPQLHKKGEQISKNCLPQNSLLSFLHEIHRVLWDSLDGLLSTAEAYYKAKGNRPITRITEIKETFDKSADGITIRMNSYDRQTREFHKKSLNEFHKQLDVNEKLMSQIPEHFFSMLSQTVLNNLKTQLINIRDDIFKVEWNKLEGEEKLFIKDQLRPHLGHPGKIDELNELIMLEEQRMEKVISLVHDIHKQTIELLQAKQTQMLEKLADYSEYFLLAFDKITVNSDCHVSEVYPDEQPKNEDKFGVRSPRIDKSKLDEDVNLRKSTKFSGSTKNNLKTRKSLNFKQSTKSVSASPSPSDKVPIQISSSGLTLLTHKIPKFNNPVVKPNWRPLKFIPTQDSHFVAFTSKEITTKRSTMCHKVVIATRTKFLVSFTSKIKEIAKDADRNKEERLKLIENWSLEWSKHIGNVKGLY